MARERIQRDKLPTNTYRTKNATTNMANRKMANKNKLPTRRQNQNMGRKNTIQQKPKCPNTNKN